MTCNRRRGRHRGRDQMRAATLALAAFKIAVRGRSTTLAGRELVGIHGQAHAAARLAPVETGPAGRTARRGASAGSNHAVL